MVDAPDDVFVIAAALIADHHTHLAEARIAFRSRLSSEGQEWRSRGKLVYGRTVAVTGPVRDLTAGDGQPVDFILVVNGDIWRALSDEGRKGVVDHQLHHMERTDGGTFYLVPHDVEEFGGVVLRHGLYTEALQRFAAAIEAAPGHRQMRLPISEAAGEEAEAPSEPPASPPPAEGDGGGNVRPIGSGRRRDRETAER